MIITAMCRLCDQPYLEIRAAAAFVDGAAFHLYAGDISALTPIHNAFPSKNLYFTEQYTPLPELLAAICNGI